MWNGVWMLGLFMIMVLCVFEFWGCYMVSMVCGKLWLVVMMMWFGWVIGVSVLFEEFLLGLSICLMM